MAGKCGAAPRPALALAPSAGCSSQFHSDVCARRRWGSRGLAGTCWSSKRRSHRTGWVRLRTCRSRRALGRAPTARRPRSTGSRCMAPLGSASRRGERGPARKLCSTSAGPAGCPANSRAGFGGGVAVVALASQLVHEQFTLDFFFASVERGHLTLLTYVSGTSPLTTGFVVVAKEIPTPKPYGLGFSALVPRISTTPGASYASVESAFATLGASDVAYFERVHGRRTLVHIKGLTVPRTCPAGGFPTRAAIEFTDGARSTVDPTIPCPRG